MALAAKSNKSIYCFYFHSVDDEKSQKFGVYGENSLSFNAFKKRINEILGLGKPILLEALNHFESLNESSVLITFDDGFKDNLKVFEYFNKHKIPFNLFITTGFVEGSTYPYEYLVSSFLQNHSLKDLSHILQHSELTGFKNYYSLYEQIKRLLKHKSISDRQALLANIFGEKIFELKEEGLFLNWGDVEELSKFSLVNIGAHGHTHVPLNALDFLGQEKEISKPKELISKYTGSSVSFFSFPYGEFNLWSKIWLKKHAFNRAFSTKAETLSNPKFINPRFKG